MPNDSWRQQQFALALMRRLLLAQANAHAGQLMPQAQVMAEARARVQGWIDAKAQAGSDDVEIPTRPVRHED